jgi:hypothetical protein
MNDRPFPVVDVAKPVRHCWVRDKGHWNCYLKPTAPRRRCEILDTSEVVEEEDLDAPDAIPIDLWHHQDNVHSPTRTGHELSRVRPASARLDRPTIRSPTKLRNSAAIGSICTGNKPKDINLHPRHPRIQERGVRLDDPSQR